MNLSQQSIETLKEHLLDHELEIGLDENDFGGLKNLFTELVGREPITKDEYIEKGFLLRKKGEEMTPVGVKIPWGMWDLYGRWTPHGNIEMSESEQFRQNLENGYFDRTINLYIPTIESG